MKQKTNQGVKNLYRIFLEAMPQSAAILAAGGEIVYANKALAKLLGRTLPRITGVPFRDFVNADDRKGFDTILRSKRAAGSRKELSLDTARGATLPVLVSSHLAPMEGDAETRLIIVDPRTMKERYAEFREAESAALAERQRLYEVMETLPAYVVLLSPDYHVPFANKFFRDRFGESRGRRCFEYLFRRKKPCENCESYTVMRTGQRHHWQWTGPDGRTYDIHDFPFRDWDGSPLVMEMGIDITEQKRAEEEIRRHQGHLEELVRERTEKLEETTARLQTTVDSLVEGLVVADLDGDLFHWNPAAVAMHGFASMEEGRRKLPEFAGIFELSTEKDGILPLDQWPLARILRGETLSNYEVHIRRLHADWKRIFNYGGALARDKDGRPFLAVVTLSDITERKREEARLAFHAGVMESMRDAVIATDSEFRITAWNQAAVDLYGWTAAEAIGRNSREILRSAMSPEEVANLIAMLAANGSATRETAQRRRDGSTVQVESKLVAMTDGGGIITGYIAANRDITDRKHAEEALRRAHERLTLAQQSAGAGVWDWNMTTDELEWSPELFELFGLDPAQDRATMETWHRIMHVDDRDVAEERIRKAIQDHERLENEYRIVLPSGDERWVSALGDTRYDAIGRPLRMSGICIDITERKRTMEDLRQSRADLDRAQAVGQIGSWRLDVGRDVLTWSDENCRIFGVPQGTPLTYETFLGIVHPDDRQYVDASWKKGMAGKPYDIEHRIVVGGEVKWVREKAHLELDDSGRLLGGFGTTQDITERKAAEEEMAHLATFPELNPNPVVEFDASGAVVFMNPAARIALKDIDAKDLPEMLLHADFQALRDDLKAGRTKKWVTEVKIENRWYLISTMPMPGFGTMRLYAIDITERRQAEEEIERSRLWLERVANTTPDIIFVLDIIDDLNVYANKSVIELLGYSPEEFGGIKDILEKVIEPEDRAHVMEFYRRMADAQRGEVRVLTMRALHRDGRTLWLENRVTPFSWDDNGELREVIGISHDVTDLKRAHEVLQRDRETFERLVDERTAELVEIHHELDKARHLSDIGMLASTVAHELRNPLGVIKTAVYNINRKKQGGALDKHLNTIDKKIDESNQIINNLLMYARIKSPVLETVRIGDLLRESIESAKARNVGRPVTFRDDCDPVANVTVSLDPYQIMEVMNNVLANAAQAIPPEGGAVTVSARTSDGLLRVCIRDTGIGIEPDMLPHVFEPFFTSKSKGTGLGLSLCMELVSLHNGSIDIESEPGKGTTVTVILPLSPGNHPAAN